MGGLYGGQKQNPVVEMDPLYSKSGAQDIRTGIFNELPGMLMQGQQDAAAAQNAARQGAASLAPAMQYAQQTVGGKYLNSPQLQGYLAQTRAASQQAARAGRSASDLAAQNARQQGLAAQQAQLADVRNQFARGGQQFGTGNQLAQQASNVALQSQLGRSEAERQAQLGQMDAARLAQLAAGENATLAENYARERANQQAATGLVGQLAGQNLNMLQAVPGLAYSGIEPAVNVIRGLASGGQTVTPGTYYKPGVGDYALQGIGTLGAAGMGW